ncbi:hypothetical protein [Planctomicrobium sp. SH664]|uniref:hypothetical protein n=1 Tax=Planctomicrobium sp. SH664 TaxID=3448125 RepID=UPI003F5C0D2F
MKPQPAHFRLPIVSAGAEHLVMGYLMRRNILTYKAPPNNEGYDLICVHPDPRNRPKRGQSSQVRVQVKSRYASDCGRGFPIKAKSLDAFDFVVVAFLNIGRFLKPWDGSQGERDPEFYTLPASFIRQHIDTSSSWEKVRLRGVLGDIEKWKNGAGFELIAKKLGVARPIRNPSLPYSEEPVE